MTDKEKIKLWAKGRLFELMDGVSEKDAESVLTDFLTFIYSLQEEPVAPKVLEDMLNAQTPAESLGISAEEHDRIVDECLYGKEPELVDVDDLPKEEPVSEDLEDAAKEYSIIDGADDIEEYARYDIKKYNSFKDGAKWQFERVNEALLSEVLPCFMHGGEADEVVAKLEEVLNQKK